MKKKMIAALLGVLLIGTLGAAVVNAATSDDAKVNDSFGQMHTLCGKYMNSGNLDSNEFESMHKSCGNYMNSGNNEGGFSCH